MTNTILHKADSRGLADHGWLKSFHTFSFGDYYNPERMQFGVLRVLNDDTVSGGRGFGDHPHDNMEIISIPIEGELVHKDSMNNTTVIKPGEIQVMSAGTGIYHTENNNNEKQPVKFLQIWVYPNKRNVQPRYQQITIDTQPNNNQLQQLLSPNPDDEGVWIYQDAWFYKGKLDINNTLEYALKRFGNGIYIFVLKGDVAVNEQILNSRDGYGIWDVEQISIKSLSDTEFLVMEVPMSI
ncbi:MAG: pirin family protein [Sphingobacteriaceae bacterium]